MAASCQQPDVPPPCPQDAKPLEVYSVDFMVDNAQLGFLGECGAWGPGSKTCGVARANSALYLVSDRDRNLMVYMYLPEGECSLLPSAGRGGVGLSSPDLGSRWLS